MLRVVVMLGLVGCGRLGFDGTPPRDGSAGSASDAGIDGARPDAPVAGPCTPLAISDDFNDGTRAAIWTLIANNPVNVAETGGQLEVTLATAGGAHYGGYDTVASNYDLRGHCIYVSYPTTPTAEVGVEMQFTVRTTVGTTGFVYHDGLLDAFSNITAFASFASVPYDATQDKVLRVSENAGMMSWETSADGTTFYVLATAPDPFDVSAIAVTLEAGTYNSEPTPGIARYENFNTP